VASRGGVYSHESSPSYKGEGKFDAGSYMTFSGFGFTSVPNELGWDDITFEYQIASGRASVTRSTIIAEMNIPNYTWLGSLGLNAKPRYLVGNRGVDTKSKLPRLIDRLVDSGTAPSRSWAYTSGSRWCKRCFHDLFDQS
jgi:hypothetical protein